MITEASEHFHTAKRGKPKEVFFFFLHFAPGNGRGIIFFPTGTLGDGKSRTILGTTGRAAGAAFGNGCKSADGDGVMCGCTTKASHTSSGPLF